MTASAWIVAGVLVVGGAGLAWWARSDDAHEEVDVASLGEVRGAPLRAPIGTPEPADDAPEAPDAPAGASTDATPEVIPDPGPEIEPGPEPDPLGEDYSDLLPDGKAAKYEWIDFPLLMDFDFPGLLTDEVDPEDLIAPEEVRELEGQPIAIEGFMNPLSFDAEGVSEFTLVSDPTFCCFGMTPQLNHYVHVTLPEGEHCDFFSMVPVAVFGTFSVGAEIEDGIVLSLYRLQAEHVLSVY